MRQLQTSLRDHKLLCPGQFLQISTSSVIRWFFLGFVYKKEPILQVVVELEEIAPQIIRLHVADNLMRICTTHQMFLDVLELHTFECDEFTAEIWTEGMFQVDYSQRFGNHFRLTPSSAAAFRLGKDFDAWVPLHVARCFFFTLCSNSSSKSLSSNSSRSGSSRQPFRAGPFSGDCPLHFVVFLVGFEH